MNSFSWQIAIPGYFLDDISTNGISFSIAWMALKNLTISQLILQSMQSDLQQEV